MPENAKAPVAAFQADAKEIELLRSIVEGTASSTGDDFLRNLVRHLAEAVGMRHSFVSEFQGGELLRTLAFWSNGQLAANLEYELSGTPCEEVIGGQECFIPSGVQTKYAPRERGIEAYFGVPLKAQNGQVLGHLCAFDEAPRAADPRTLYLFRIFAGRAAAELERLRTDKELRENEDRLRDLFEEAPIAYVHEGIDTRFIRANRAALRILGVKPEEVPFMYGRTLIPDTPDAQRRLKAALESVGHGTDTGGTVLELRRKDDGRPIFIQWWSKADPSGTYTRTMFIDITERILLEREQERLQAQNIYLREEIKSVHNFEEIVGSSRGLVGVLRDVQRVAPTDATVLIFGETGTGKELIARATHSASNRADKPFIKINCAALPAGLIESELFGHERGAFSGAIQRRIGRFELANGGTIFLDEIGEVSGDVQLKLLRVLQEQEFERIGGNQTIKCDVRVIAATNRDLPNAVASGAFRADLFYRLNVFPVKLPPLRDRAEDIPLLVRFFVQKYAPKVGRQVSAIEGKTIERLVRYDWPGNIRELENIVERALILSSTPVLSIGEDVLPVTLPVPPRAAERGAPTAAAALTEQARNADRGGAIDLDSVQREHILTTLRQADWVVEGKLGAAVKLGMKPATLRHRMKKLGISRPSESGG
jgi:formate hydrogenlyase transcriptional activator